MKKILFASHSSRLSGAPHVLYNIVSSVDRSTFEPLVLFPENGPIIEKFEAASIPTAVIDIGDNLWGKLHIPMIEALCIAKDIDLVHANTIHAFPFVAASGKRGVPCFWYIHEMLGSGLSFDLSEEEFADAAERVSMVGTVSRACEREFAQYCQSLGIAVPEIVVAHNGVRLPESCEYRKPEDPVELLSIGNTAPHKGHRFLIEALGLLSRKNRRPRLTIVGDNQYRRVGLLWKQAERLGVDGQVRLLTPEMDVEERIERSDIVVIPSLVENFSLAIAEAMARAKPVVATDVGGTGELLTDGETGLLVPSEDPEALADAILRFIENPEFARQCGEKARKCVAENFTIQRQVAQLQEIYLSLLSGRRPPEGRSPSEDAADIYDLLAEALVSVNEKLSRMDKQITNDHNVTASNHFEIRKSRERIEYLSQYTSNVERDIRTLEAVVDGLLQKLPFRLVRKLKALLTSLRRD